MKRNLKPFSVEIKKSRVQGQRHQLPPRRLFEVVQVGAPKVFQTEMPPVADEQAAPRRILPSLIEPEWSKPEAVESARRKRPLGSKIKEDHMELDLTAIHPDEVKDAPSAASVISKVISPTDVAHVSEGDPTSADETGAQVLAGAKAKSREWRTKAPEAVEQAMASNGVAVVEQALEKGVIAPSPVEIVPQVSHRRLTKRQAAAAQLPRHERWKRRLHPASW